MSDRTSTTNWSTLTKAADSAAAGLCDRPYQAISEGSKEGVMGKFMKNIEKYAKSPKAKSLEKKMVDKAKDPKTKAKISKRFKRWGAKH